MPCSVCRTTVKCVVTHCWWTSCGAPPWPATKPWPTTCAATGTRSAMPTTAAPWPPTVCTPPKRSVSWTCGARRACRSKPTAPVLLVMPSKLWHPRPPQRCRRWPTAPPSSWPAKPPHWAAPARSWWCWRCSRSLALTPTPPPACWTPSGVYNSPPKSATGSGVPLAASPP